MNEKKDRDVFEALEEESAELAKVIEDYQSLSDEEKAEVDGEAPGKAIVIVPGGEKKETPSLSPLAPHRVRMPDERRSVTHKFTLLKAHKEMVLQDDGKYKAEMVDVEGYVTAGVYPDGRLGEVFMTVGKHGGPWKVYDCLMVAVSIGLQSGIPLDVFTAKFKLNEFEPHGVTKNPDIPLAKSIVDYLFKYLERRFPGGRAEDMATVTELDIAMEGSDNELGGDSAENEGEEMGEGGDPAVPVREGEPST